MEILQWHATQNQRRKQMVTSEQVVAGDGHPIMQAMTSIFHEIAIKIN